MSTEGQLDPSLETAKMSHSFGRSLGPPMVAGTDIIHLLPALKEREQHIERLHGIVVAQAELVLKLSERVVEGEEEQQKGRRAL